MSDYLIGPGSVPYVDPTAGINGVSNTLGYNPNRNMQAAAVGMGLTPEEIALYQHHLNNLQRGGVANPDGTTSTLYQVGFQDGGRTYNVPSIYGNAKLSPDDAINAAYGTGLSTFPSYASDFQAENRYHRMHNYMEQDMPKRLF